jgi:hypothetical protein
MELNEFYPKPQPSQNIDPTRMTGKMKRSFFFIADDFDDVDDFIMINEPKRAVCIGLTLFLLKPLYEVCV